MDYQKKVQDVLDRAVEAGTECGCQAALYINGKLEVNAFAGWTDWTKTKKIDENTIFPVYSTGKAPSSTLIHRLVEEGLLSYDAKISSFWPEFGCSGKEDILVRDVLSYRSSLITVPESTDEEQADWETMLDKMAHAAPDYPVRTKQQYHPQTYGWLTGGIACHALGRFDYFNIFKEYVALPAGMDRFFYGISPDENNAATLVSAPDGRSYRKGSFTRMNNPLFRTCCNPSSCTLSNALSIARHYAAIDTGKIMKKSTLDYAVSLAWRDPADTFSMQRGRWELFGLGYVLSGPTDDVTRIFGHGGFGGSEGLLDRKNHYAIAITRNCFANPNVMDPFYAAVDFKNRDWPEPADN